MTCLLFLRHCLVSTPERQGYRYFCCCKKPVGVLLALLVLFFMVRSHDANAQYLMHLPTGLRTMNGLPVDAKYYNTAGRPYGSVDEATAELKYEMRGIGLTVNIGGLEYWFRDGIDDDDLVLKLPVWNCFGDVPGVILYTSGKTRLGGEWALRWNADHKALGVGVLTIHSTGSSNTFVGMNAGNYSIPDSVFGGNTALGAGTLSHLSGGYTNSAIGLDAGQNITTGSMNSLLGHSAGSNMTTGSGNTFIGSSAGGSNLSGNDNVALGRLAGAGYGLTGNGNTLLGSALYGLSTGNRNVMIGNNLTIQSAKASGQLTIQNIIFGTGNLATGTEVSRGSIGIGIANPSATLHVLGATKLQGTVTLPEAGNGIFIKEGSNATMGTVTLVAGKAVVNTTRVTANSRIMLSIQALGTVTIPTAVGVTDRTPGTSFTISSANPTDTSVLAWIIVEPAP